MRWPVSTITMIDNPQSIEIQWWTCLLSLYCRYLSGSSMYGGPPAFLPVPGSTFVPTPPPNLSHLISRQQSQRARKASPSSLPGRLNRALSLGTIPSLTRTGQCSLLSQIVNSAQIVSLEFICACVCVRVHTCARTRVCVCVRLSHVDSDNAPMGGYLFLLI